MKQIDCSGLQILDESGNVLVDDIIDLLIGAEEKTEYYDFHPVVISLPEMNFDNHPGQVFHVWDSERKETVCLCQADGIHYDFQRGANKVEGKHYTATRFKGR